MVVNDSKTSVGELKFVIEEDIKTRIMTAWRWSVFVQHSTLFFTFRVLERGTLGVANPLKDNFRQTSRAFWSD